MVTAIVNICYLIGAISFVWGLRLLSSPNTAARGNFYAAAGMILAIFTAILEPIEGAANNYLWIVGGMIIGSIIGLLMALRVQMTAMPEMVSILNGFGGACAMVLAMIELFQMSQTGQALALGGGTIILLTLIIGSVSFSGSMLAYLKLAGKVKDKHVTFNGHQYLNVLLLIIVLAGASFYLFNTGYQTLSFSIPLLVLALVYGFSFVAPIGGADMPVVISLLNSLTGLSAATAGVIYGSQIMLTGGILVGASGTILTIIMCKAMNRSLANVIIGNFGGSAGGGGGGAVGDQTYKEISVSDLAIQLYYSERVIIVPGYGLAVAQAQKVVQEVDALLSANGVEVIYGIHPVAGRMPGHMNVLLAEANVPYEQLLTLEDANDKIPGSNVAIIVGANDVVNPAALDEPGSPIYGMPVLEVWKADTAVILKRSMNPGYAGIQNPLFFKDNSSMLFGDAKDSISKIVTELKNI
jgi:NAD(P) transhydrogenase subunit beta